MFATSRHWRAVGNSVSDLVFLVFSVSDLVFLVFSVSDLVFLVFSVSDLVFLVFSCIFILLSRFSRERSKRCNELV